MHWVGPLLGAACAALSCHVLLYPGDEEEEEVGEEEKGKKGGPGSGRGQRNAIYRGGADSEEAPLCVSLSTSQLLQKSGSTRPLNRSMSGGAEWRGEGEGSRERREVEGREERELRREGGERGEKEEREEKHSGSSSGYMSGPPGRSR